MNEANYRYELEEGFVIIENLQSTYSVYVHLEEVLANIEAEIGSLGSTPILCEGLDGCWDLVVPRMKGEARIYPLNARSLAEAKVKLGHLVAGGQI